MNENVTQEFENDIGSWDWVEQVEKHVPATSAAELMEMTIAPKEFVVREILTLDSVCWAVRPSAANPGLCWICVSMWPPASRSWAFP